MLTRGHLFLNCSLTEAFCIAILEAVSCGLYVVSTRVGGVPEILPPDVMSFAEPRVDAIVASITRAIPHVMRLYEEKRNYQMEVHEMVRQMYNWHTVAERTERVYRKVLDEHQQQQLVEDHDNNHFEASPDTSPLRTPSAHSSSHLSPLPSIPPDKGSLFSLSLTRLSAYSSCGIFAGLLFALVVILDHLLWRALEYIDPRDSMDVAIDFKKDEYIRQEKEAANQARQPVLDHQYEDAPRP